jgi:hypothetical protein
MNVAAPTPAQPVTYVDGAGVAEPASGVHGVETRSRTPRCLEQTSGLRWRSSWAPAALALTAVELGLPSAAVAGAGVWHGSGFFEPVLEVVGVEAHVVTEALVRDPSFTGLRQQPGVRDAEHLACCPGVDQPREWKLHRRRRIRCRSLPWLVRDRGARRPGHGGMSSTAPLRRVRCPGAGSAGVVQLDHGEAWHSGLLSVAGSSVPVLLRRGCARGGVGRCGARRVDGLRR